MTDARAPSVPDQDLTRLAIDYLRLQPAASDASVGFLADGDVQTTSAGVRIVHLHQEYRGIPVHGGSVAVHFGTDGRVESVGAVQRVSSDVTMTPQVGAPAAVLSAARHVAGQMQASEATSAIKVSDRPPVQLGRFPHPSRPTMLHKPPFRDPVTARLVLFGPEARLAWEIHLRLPRADGEWNAIIAADVPNEPPVLHAWRTLAHATHGLVYERNPSEAIRTKLPCRARELTIRAWPGAGFPRATRSGREDTGTGWLVGVGYDLPLGRTISLGLDVVWSHLAVASAAGPDASFLSTTFGFRWHP